MGSSLVSWWSKKQTLHSISSTKEEYRSIASTVAESLWLQSLLTELQIPFTAPQIFCDDMKTVTQAHKPALHCHTKHMELDIFFFRKKVLKKQLYGYHVPTEDQIADILTHALAPTRFQFLCKKVRDLRVIDKFALCMVYFLINGCILVFV